MNKGFEVLIRVDDRGTIEVKSPDGMAPMFLTGLLDFAKTLVQQQMLNPSKASSIIPAPATALDQLKANGTNRLPQG